MSTNTNLGNLRKLCRKKKNSGSVNTMNKQCYYVKEKTVLGLGHISITNYIVQDNNRQES